MIYLETDRLILRDYVTGDFDDFYRLKTDDQTMYYMGDIRSDSIESAKAEFANVLEDMASSESLFIWVISHIRNSGAKDIPRKL